MAEAFALFFTQLLCEPMAQLVQQDMRWVRANHPGSVYILVVYIQHNWYTFIKYYYIILEYSGSYYSVLFGIWEETIILSTVIDQSEFYQISLASGFWNEQTLRYVPVNAEACGYIGSGRPNTKTFGNFQTFTVGFVWNLIILFPSWHNVLGKKNRKSGEVEDILFFFGSKPWRHNCHRQALQKTARW